MRWIAMGLMLAIFATALGWHAFACVACWQGKRPEDLLESWWDQWFWRNGSKLMICGIVIVAALLAWAAWAVS